MLTVWGGTGSGQQDPQPPRGRRLQVELRRCRQEAPGQEHRMPTHPFLPPQLRSLTMLQVNPDIVGGLVVEVGDRTIDLSVSSKLSKMNKLLTDTL